MKKLITIIQVLGMLSFILYPYSEVYADDLTTNLNAYWKLDESSGNATDEVGSLVLTNNNTVGYVAAKINNGGDLEKSTPSYFTRADPGAGDTLDITGDLTLNFWINLESAPSATEEYQLVNKASAYAIVYWNSTVPNGFGFFINGAGGSINQTLSTGTWYMITTVYDASAGSCEIFVNGSSIGTVTGLATSINDTAGTFQVGTRIPGDTTVNFDGVVDELGVWSRVLSGSEITSLYNSGSGLSYDNFGGGGAAASPRRIIIQ